MFAMGYLVYQWTLLCYQRVFIVPVNNIVLTMDYLVHQSTLLWVTNGLINVPFNIIVCY